MKVPLHHLQGILLNHPAIDMVGNHYLAAIHTGNMTADGETARQSAGMVAGSQNQNTQKGKNKFSHI